MIQETPLPRSKTGWLYLAIAGYIIIFLLTRLLHLTDLPPTVDEQRHIIRAQLTLAEGDLFIGLRQSMKQLYIWAAAAVLPLFSDHIFAARLISVLSGLGTAAICYTLATWLYGRRLIGYLAALYYLVSPLALFYDRVALTDSLLTLLMGAAILLSCQLWRRPTWRWAALLGVVFGLGALTKAYAAFYYPAPLLFWLILGRSIGWRRIFTLLGTAYGVALIAWLPILVVGAAIFLEDHSQKLIFEPSTKFWTDIIGQNLLTNTGWLTGYLTLPFGTMFLFSLLLMFIRRDKPGLILMILFFLPAVLFTVSLTHDANRYLLPGIVPLAIIIAWGIAQAADFLRAPAARAAPGPARSPLLPLGLFLLLALPALRFSYLIVTQIAQAPLPPHDKDSFVEGLFAGYGLKESAAVVADLAERSPHVILLRGANMLDALFSLEVAGMGLYLQETDNVTYREIGALDAATLPILNRYAQEAPTLTLGTFAVEGQSMPQFDQILELPQAWLVASFLKPGQRYMVRLYQWLLWPDFALHWLQQGGDADPQVMWQPGETRVTAVGGRLIPWPEDVAWTNLEDWSRMTTAANEAGVEYVLANVDLVNKRPDFFAPYLAVDGARLRLRQPPPGWRLAFVYPDINCEWCIFYVRPPQQTTTINFGEALDLEGYDLSLPALKAGETLFVTLYWRSRPSFVQEIASEMQLVDEAGQVAVRVVQPPLQGRWPASAWSPGAAVVDRLALELPASLPAGTYRLWLSVTDAASGQRLPVQAAALPALENAVQLTTVIVK